MLPPPKKNLGFLRFGWEFQILGGIPPVFPPALNTPDIFSQHWKGIAADKLYGKREKHATTESLWLGC